MLTTTSGLKIYVYTRSTEILKGINGLSGLVREASGADPTDGSLFVFINHRRDCLKILVFPRALLALLLRPGIGNV